MLNKVILIGRLARDPFYSTTTTGVGYARCVIAVSRRAGNSNEEATEFIPFVAWRSNAEFLNKFFAKGSLIAIEGYISTSQFVNSKGETVRNTEVVVDSFVPLENKKTRESRGNTQTINLNYKNNEQNTSSFNINPEQTNTFSTDETPENNLYGFSDLDED